MTNYKGCTSNIRITRLKGVLVVIALALLIFSVPLSVIAANVEINLTAVPDDTNPDTHVRLEWSSVPGALIYRVSRNLDGDDTWDEIAEINVNETLNPRTYTDTGLGGNGLIPETLYNYTIVTEDAEGNVINTDNNTASVTTSEMLAPTVISAKYNVNSQEITITWENNSIATAGSIIERVEPSNDPINEDVVTGTTITFSDDDAVDAAMNTGEVKYVVISEDTTDESGHSSPASDSVTVKPIEPPVINDVLAVDGVCEIILQTCEHRSEFELQRSEYNGTVWGDWMTVSADILHNDDENVDFVMDMPETAGIYRYRVNAKSTGSYMGCSAISDEAYVPAAPSGITCSVSGEDTIDLSWENDPDNRSGLRIERREGETGEFTLIDTVSYDTNEYEDMFDYNLETTYYYRITAFDSEDNQAVSSLCSVSTAAPLAPTSLSLVVQTQDRVVLNWVDNSDNEDGFIIEKKIDSGDFTEEASVEAGTETYVDEDIQTGHTYTYRVCARNNIGHSNYTNQASTTAETIVAPSSLIVTPQSSSSIKLTWTYPESGSYRTMIERKTGETGSWMHITTVSAGTMQYTNTGLSADTQYFYRIRSVTGSYVQSRPYPDNDIGIDAYTMLGSLTLSASASASNRIRLTWSGNSGGTHFVIERRTASGDFTPVSTVSSGTSFWYDTSVVPNAEYTYRIKAVSLANESIYSNEEVVANTYLVGIDNLEASTTRDMYIELTWEDNSNNETGFEIWKRVYGESSYELYYTTGSNVTRFIDEDVEEGVQYYYRVRAFAIANNTYSSFKSSGSVGVGVLNPPSDLEYSILSDRKIKLTWQDNSDNESGFRVERKIGNDGVWNTVASLSKNKENYTDSRIDSNVKYYYRIKAYSNNYNNGSYSEEILVSTAKPEAPSNLTSTVLSSSQVKLEWKDNSHNEQGFRIERRMVGESRFKVAGKVDVDVTSYSDSGLASNKMYIYRVCAYNEAGDAYTVYSYARTKEAVEFSDMKGAAWAEKAVESLASRGIIKNDGKGNFRPNDIISRAEFTCLVVRAIGVNMTPVGSLADVDVSKWYYNEVMAARSLGIISGDSKGRFYPEAAVTREDMAVIAVKALKAIDKPLMGYSNDVLEGFWDKNQISTYAISSMASLVGEGLLKGKSVSSIAPKGNATRAEAADLIYNTIE